MESQPAKQGSSNGYEIQIKELQEQPTVTIRRWCEPTKLTEMFSEILPKAYSYATSNGATVGGAPFSRYHGMKDGKMDVEAGVPLAKKLEGQGEIQASTLPAGRVLVTWHVGPYHELGKAHETLEAWAKKNDLEIAGAPWEVYWTDPGQEPDPSKWRTEVLLPIE